MVAYAKSGAPVLGKRRRSWHEEQMHIAYEFAVLLENGRRSAIVDESELPYPKETTLHALLYAIGTADTEETAQAFNVCLIVLSNYQPGVGAPVEIPELLPMLDTDALERWVNWKEKANAEARANQIWGDKARNANPRLNGRVEWLRAQYREGGIKAAYTAFKTGRAPIPLPPAV